MKRTFEEINAKIQQGDAVVMTAEEAIKLAESKGIEKAAKEVDVVTTGTFGAMCSSGAFINFGHSEPPIRIKRAWLNGVPAYSGIAAVDAYIGATEEKEEPGQPYGGAHVIEDLVAGKAVHLRATAAGTDCYPRKDIDTYISLRTVNQAYMYNPRNTYQNYGVATNSSDRALFTYMGKLLPHYGNMTYSSAGQLSPLLKDPHLRTIGIGTRIFMGGGIGYVAWEGTQYKTTPRELNGAPVGSARSLALIGDLRGMTSEFVQAMSFTGYGISLGLGVGVPIPILDEDLMRTAVLRDDQIFAPVLDYAIQSRGRKPIAEVSYAQLRSGTVELFGKKVQTSSLSSYYKARIIADRLKRMIEEREFTLTKPVEQLPEERMLRALDVCSEEDVL